MPDFKKMMANANSKIDIKDTIKNVENIYEDTTSLSSELDKPDKSNNLNNTINETSISPSKKEKVTRKTTKPNKTSDSKPKENRIENIVKTFNYQKDGVKKGINISVEHEQFIKKTARQSGMTIQQYIAYIFLTSKEQFDKTPEKYDEVFYKCKELKSSSKSRFTVSTLKEVADYIDEGAMKSGVSISGFEDYAIECIIEKK